jgi:hypothetical protein
MIYEKTQDNAGYVNYIRPFDVLYRESAEESANYIRSFLNEVIICESGWWNIALNNINDEGLCLEFGVFEGKSLNFFSDTLKHRIWYGFDSFCGLQENWRGGWFPKNHFSLNGELPKVNNNVKLIKGWFKNTLPIFLKKNKEKISFIHIDCDTYESTLDVLNNIEYDRFVNNSIILFDEYLGYINWKNHEFKAWQEYVKKNNIKYKYIAFGCRQAVIQILK